ncbi:hypothetical protein KI387_037376, partial [Taxus chinensis]
MEPKNPISTPKKGKDKGKQQETNTHTNEEWYAKMQYPNAVMVVKEWESHLKNMSVNDYNH